MGSFNSRGRAKQKAQKKSNRFKNKPQEQGSPPTMSNGKFVSKKRKPVLTAGKTQQPSSVIFVQNTKHKGRTGYVTSLFLYFFIVNIQLTG
jgi:hypothetical protein